MNHIKRSLAIAGILSILSVFPSAGWVYGAQPGLQKFDFRNYYRQGVENLESGNFKGAIANFDRLVQLNPGYYEGFCLRGLAKSQLGNFKLLSLTTVKL